MRFNSLVNTSKHLQQTFFFGFLLAVFFITFLIFKPYLITLGTAATFAVVMQPLYRWFRKRLWERNSIAALLTMIVTMVLIMIPIALIGTKVIQEARALYSHLTSQGENVLDIGQVIEQLVNRYFPEANVDINAYLRQGLAWVGSHLGTLFTGTLQTLLQLFLGLMAFFYLLKDGDVFIQRVISLSPLSDSYDHRILSRLDKAINSIIKGSLLIALLQGFSSGIGLTIFGVPSPALWGTATAFAALLPGVGTASVLFPAILYLFFTDQIVSAIGLSIWSGIAVGMIDNFLGPILVGRGVRIHPLFILIAVFGGIEMFGPLGFILGPLILSLLYALLDIYRLFIIRKDRLTT